MTVKELLEILEREVRSGRGDYAVTVLERTGEGYWPRDFYGFSEEETERFLILPE